MVVKIAGGFYIVIKSWVSRTLGEFLFEYLLSWINLQYKGYYSLRSLLQLNKAFSKQAVLVKEPEWVCKVVYDDK